MIRLMTIITLPEVKPQTDNFGAGVTIARMEDEFESSIRGAPYATPSSVVGVFAIEGEHCDLSFRENIMEAWQTRTNMLGATSPDVWTAHMPLLAHMAEVGKELALESEFAACYQGDALPQAVAHWELVNRGWLVKRRDLQERPFEQGIRRLVIRLA